MVFPSFPTGTPPLLVILVIIVLAMLTFMERLAKLSGPIGSLARWFQRKQVREVERKSELDTAIDKAVEKRVEQEIKPWKSAIQRLEREVNRLSAKLELKDRETEWLLQYITKVTAWWHRLKIRLAAQGVEVEEEMPEFRGYPPESED